MATVTHAKRSALDVKQAAARGICGNSSVHLEGPCDASLPGLPSDCSTPFGWTALAGLEAHKGNGSIEQAKTWVKHGTLEHSLSNKKLELDNPIFAGHHHVPSKPLQR